MLKQHEALELEALHNISEAYALYVYGIVVKENPADWKEAGIENNQVFAVSLGKLHALVHRCEAKAYQSNNVEKVKEWVLAHNNVLEKAKENFGAVLPFSFDVIVQEKHGKNAEENLKEWLGKEEKKIEQLWIKIKDKEEYALKFFFDHKKWFDEIKAKDNNNSSVNSTNEKNGDGISYLLKERQKSEIKDKVIKRIINKREELFKEIKAKVQEIEVIKPKVRLFEEKRDVLLCLSVLADKKQFHQVKEYLQKNMDKEDYQYAGPYPPYSFMESLDGESGK